MKALAGLVLAAGVISASPALALNILLSNDDGYQHPNIRALYSTLKAAGHTVRIAAPKSEQSARGGAFYYGREVSIGRDDDPAYPDSYFLSTHEQGPCTSPICAGQSVSIEISATPVMAVLMGLKKVMPDPDLVIVGPNPGNNVGAINLASGTFNAASAALQTGVPTLAVSTDLKDHDPQRTARFVLRLVQALEQQRPADGKLLPAGIGLNINLPAGSEVKGIRLTRIGRYVGFDTRYTDDLGSFGAALSGKPGIGFSRSAPASDTEQDDEAVWLAKGYLTISPFSGLLQSPAATPALQRLSALPAPDRGQTP